MNFSLRILFPALLAGALLTIGSGCSAQARKARRLDQANRHFVAGAYEEAEIEYLNVLKIEPLDPEAIARLAIIYFDQGRVGRIYAYLSKARELRPNDLEVRIRLARFLAPLDARQARAEALFVLEKRPEDKEAPVLLAEVATKADEIAETKRLLSALPPAAVAKAPVLTALGLLQARQQNAAGALDMFQRATVADPESAAAHLGAGMVSWAQRDVNRAETALAKAAELSPLRSTNRLQYLRFKMQIGQVDVARKLIADLNQQVPDYIPAWIFAAELDAGEQKYSDALNAAGKALNRDPAHPEALLLSGRLRLASGQAEKAVADLERGVSLYPKSAPMHHQLGLAYLANGDAAKASASLNQAVTTAPGYLPAVVALAELQIRQGNSVAATGLLRQLVQQHPRFEQAYGLLAQAYLAQKKLDDAITVYRQMDELFPRKPETSLQIGITLAQQNKRGQARAAFDKALQLNPKFLPALEQLVNFDLAEKEFAIAQKRVEKFLAAQPDDTGALLELAKVFNHRGDTRQAEATLQRVIKLRPDVAASYVLLARLYRASQQHEKAIAHLEQAAKANPKGVDALMMLGALYAEQKNYTAARTTYEKLLAINPKFSAALNNLAYLYSEQFDELDKAFEMAQRARELLPREPNAADTLGWVLCKRGQYPWALSLLTESAEKLPTTPDVQFHLGLTHYMLGEEQSARAALERALKLSPDFAGVQLARDALAILDLDPDKAGDDAISALEKRKGTRPDPVALTRLGGIHARAGAMAKAVASYDAALKASPNNITAARGLIQVYRQQKNPTKAIELAKNARKLAPADAEVAQALGELAFESGDHPWAYSLLQESVKTKSADPESLFAFATAAYAVGQEAAAVTAVRAALEANPEFKRANEARQFAEMLELSAAPAKAVAEANRIDEVLKKDPTNLAAITASAAAKEHRHDRPGAIQAYESALNRFRHFTPAQRNLALLLAAEAPKDPKALDFATKARAAFPDDPHVAKALGVILFQQGNYSRSLTILQESGRRLSSDGEVFFYAGMAQQHLNDQVASAQSLRKALELGLPNDLAAEAERSVAAAQN